MVVMTGTKVSSLSDEELQAEITKRALATEEALSDRATAFIKEYQFFSKLSQTTKNGNTRTFMQLDTVTYTHLTLPTTPYV